VQTESPSIIHQLTGKLIQKYALFKPTYRCLHITK